MRIATPREFDEFPLMMNLIFHSLTRVSRSVFKRWVSCKQIMSAPEFLKFYHMSPLFPPSLKPLMFADKIFKYEVSPFMSL